MTEVLIDALIDALKLVPLLLTVHVLIEVFEDRAASKLHGAILCGKFSPLIGTAVGIIPQCGFSVVATNLYVDRRIPLGTLLAVYIVTSDEALPILLSDIGTLDKILPLLAVKVVMAIITGYLVNALCSRKEETVKQVEIGGVGCHHHSIGDEKHSGWTRYLVHPILHTATVFAYILVVNIVMGIIIYYVGQDRLVAFVNRSQLLQPLFAAIIGVIPNCAASVTITQLYASGALTLGAAVSGLSVNAGLGYAVLVKDNKNSIENALIIGGLFALSVAVGMVITLVM